MRWWGLWGCAGLKECDELSRCEGYYFRFLYVLFGDWVDGVFSKPALFDGEVEKGGEFALEVVP